MPRRECGRECRVTQGDLVGVEAEIRIQSSVIAQSKEEDAALPARRREWLRCTQSGSQESRTQYRPGRSSFGMPGAVG